MSTLAITGKGQHGPSVICRGQQSAAFTIPSLNIDKKFKLCHYSSIYAAEMTAIKEVVSWIIDNDSSPECSYAIFSDFLCVLSSLKEGICKSRPNLFNELLDLLNKL